jgi:Uncharacterized protein conserved in bacteria
MARSWVSKNGKWVQTTITSNTGSNTNESSKNSVEELKKKLGMSTNGSGQVKATAVTTAVETAKNAQKTKQVIKGDINKKEATAIATAIATAVTTAVETAKNALKTNKPIEFKTQFNIQEDGEVRIKKSKLCKVSYAGEQENNKPHGFGVLTVPDGEVWRGKFHEGTLVIGIRTDANGDKENVYESLI